MVLYNGERKKSNTEAMVARLQNPHQLQKAKGFLSETVLQIRKEQDKKNKIIFLI
jgi:hypothetical protein